MNNIYFLSANNILIRNTKSVSTEINYNVSGFKVQSKKHYK